MSCRRFRVVFGGVAVWFLTAGSVPAATTIWDLRDTLDAASGQSVLSYRDAATESGTSFAVTTGSPVPIIDTTRRSWYMSFPVSGSAAGFVVDRPGADAGLNAYTLAWDLLVPSSSFGTYSYMGLFNTSPGGASDAELFIDLTASNAGRLFADRDSDNSKVQTSTGVIKPDTWHRVVFAYDENHATQDVRIFVDGVKVGYSNASFGLPGETGFTMPDMFPVFQDGGPQTDHAPGLVSAMALVDRAMTDSEVSAMGVPKANGFGLICPPVASPPSPNTTPVKGFNVVLFPDTQNETETVPAMYQSQVDWIVANRSSQKIAYVGHLGDITDNGNATEFSRAHGIMFGPDGQSGLNGAKNLPWGTTAGNHDCNTTAKAALYHQYFGPSNFTDKEWYGDTTSKLSSYQIFTAEGRDYLVLNIEYAGDATVRAWAQGVIDAHPDMATILNTHMYFTPDGGYESYATTLWNGLINNNSQIFLVVCGHHDSRGPKYATRTNAAGQTVYELMTDYQQIDYGGGYLRLLNFDEGNSMIHASVYSPYYDLEHTKLEYDQFDIPMDFDARLGEAAGPGDANLDGVVNDDDAAILAQNWLDHGGWRHGDFTGDGLIDDRDAAILAAHWVRGGESGAVPEPSTTTILAAMLLGGAIFVRRKSRAAA